MEISSHVEWLASWTSWFGWRRAEESNLVLFASSGPHSIVVWNSIWTSNFEDVRFEIYILMYGPLEWRCYPPDSQQVSAWQCQLATKKHEHRKPSNFKIENFRRQPNEFSKITRRTFAQSCPQLERLSRIIRMPLFGMAGYPPLGLFSNTNSLKSLYDSEALESPKAS